MRDFTQRGYVTRDEMIAHGLCDEEFRSRGWVMDFTTTNWASPARAAEFEREQTAVERVRLRSMVDQLKAQLAEKERLLRTVTDAAVDQGQRILALEYELMERDRAQTPLPASPPAIFSAIRHSR